MKTKQFKISRSTILKSALHTSTYRWVWVALAVMVVSGTLAAVLFDWRWGLVTTMLVLVLAPGVMGLLYLSYAMSLRCLPDAFPHIVTFNDEDFTVVAEIPPLPPKEDDVNNENQEPASPKTLSFTARYTDIKKIRVTLSSIIIYLHGAPPGIIHIPYEHLEEAGEADFLIKKCKNL
ncbi:MAG: hypothetical protein NC217_00380 [Muribaculaceae bacterium]|nr:hypothetical protein [Muribaculaceae bacterium]